MGGDLRGVRPGPATRSPRSGEPRSPVPASALGLAISRLGGQAAVRAGLPRAGAGLGVGRRPLLCGSPCLILRQSRGAGGRGVSPQRRRCICDERPPGRAREDSGRVEQGRWLWCPRLLCGRPSPLRTQASLHLGPPGTPRRVSQHPFSRRFPSRVTSVGASAQTNIGFVWL